MITDRRPANPDADALYFLTPKEHIVDCLMADFQKRKYKKAHLVWTARAYLEGTCTLSRTR